MKTKNDSEKYLLELQRFLDIVENVEDEKLRKEIVNQMIKCNQILIEKINKEKDRR